MISDPQDVGALKGILCFHPPTLETYNQVKAIVDKADYTSKSYFGKDKSKQISQILEEPLKKLDQVPIDLSTLCSYNRTTLVSDKALKANFIYLRGKITDLLSDTYSKPAEDLISKAVPFFSEISSHS